MEIGIAVTIAGVLLAAIAVLLAAHPIAQAIWGSPRLTISLVRYRKGGVQGLRCEIVNPPIETRLLRILRVRRATAEDVVTNFRITEYRDQRKMFEAMPYIDTHAGERAQRVALPASMLPSSFGIAIRQGNEVKPGFDPSIAEVLRPGLYDVIVRVDSAEDHYEKRGQFIVQTETPLAYWLPKTQPPGVNL